MESAFQIPIKISFLENAKFGCPSYATMGSSGFDIQANLDKPLIICNGEVAKIPTGFKMAIPFGYELQIRSRSGLSIKGVTVANSPGTVDSDYRGEVCVILINLSNESFTIKDGERICQMIIGKHENVTWKPVIELNSTIRGEGGFGHTGK